MEPRENIRDLRDSIFSSAFRHLLWLKAAVNLVRDFGRRPAWVISNFIDREISDRFGGPLVYSNDMLSRLLAFHNEDPTRSPLAPVKNGSLIVPGFDIVSNACSKILDELCRKPHLMVELRKEIDSCVNSLEPKWTLSSRQLKQMGYLAAVTHEAIRIHPAAGFPLEAIVPDAGALIMGRYFPRKVSHRVQVL
jgi:cytochrome P450